jgi:hypothetical protein
MSADMDLRLSAPQRFTGLHSYSVFENHRPVSGEYKHWSSKKGPFKYAPKHKIAIFSIKRIK